MESSGYLAHLSETALRLAARLGQVEESRLATWLYSFGRLPRTPAIDRDFGSGDEPMGVLGLSRGASVRRLLEHRYVASTDKGWYSFFRSPLEVEVRAECKLYVSPRPEALADAFPIIAATFANAGVRSFKVGRGREGLLRSDKIVAYLTDRAQLDDVACALDLALTGCPAHGVPFTAEIGGEGLLSWGVDPDSGVTPTSWRSWVTRRLATGLVADPPGPDGDPVERALDTIRAAGVDPRTWTPASDRSVAWTSP